MEVGWGNQELFVEASHNVQKLCIYELNWLIDLFCNYLYNYIYIYIYFFFGGEGAQSHIFFKEGWWHLSHSMPKISKETSCHILWTTPNICTWCSVWRDKWLETSFLPCSIAFTRRFVILIASSRVMNDVWKRYIILLLTILNHH